MSANERTAAAPAESAIPVALSTASVYPENCAAGFRYASLAGYDGVEVMVWSDGASRDAAALRSLSRRYDIPVVAIHAPTLLITQRVWGSDPWAKLERSAELAAELGATTVVAHPPFRWQKDYAEGFEEGVERITSQYGVDVAVENMYPWRARSRHIEAYLPGWDPRDFNYRHVTLDLSHAATAHQDSLQMAQMLGDRLRHVHMCDGAGSMKDEHLLPGRGTQPCTELLRYLSETNFGGTVVLEINTRRAGGEQVRLALVREALEFTRKGLNQNAAGVSSEVES